jgi:hypothetical protein
MSVLDEKVIDFAGIEKKAETNSLILTICDHLSWGEETDDVHLLMLQNKINSYLSYIESGELNERFVAKDYDNIVIEIIAKYPFSSDCIKFFNMSKQIIVEAGFGLEWKNGEK